MRQPVAKTCCQFVVFFTSAWNKEGSLYGLIRIHPQLATKKALLFTKKIPMQSKKFENPDGSDETRVNIKLSLPEKAGKAAGFSNFWQTISCFIRVTIWTEATEKIELH